MCSEETIKRIDKGEVFTVNKKAFQWGAWITLIVWLAGAVYVFGVWKSGVDNEISNVKKDVVTLTSTGSVVAFDNQHRLDTVIHNLKRLMEKDGLRWEELK